MEVIFIFILAGLIIFLGFFGEIIFRKTSIPDVLFLILFGILISKVFHWVDPMRLGVAPLIFTTFALLFMAFEDSLHLDVARAFKEMGRGALLTIANFVISFIVVLIIARLFSLSWLVSILLAVILAGTSGEVVLPIINNLRLRQISALTLTIETALGDILCIGGTLTIVQIAAVGAFSWSSLLNNFFGSFIIAIAIGFVFGIVWVFILKKIEQLSKSYMVTIAFILLLYSFVQWLHYNGPIACLTFGLVLVNSRKILSLFHREEYALNITPSQKFFFSEINFFVKTFFFVYLGMIINFTDIKLIAISAFITIAVFMARPLATYLTFRKGIISRDRAIIESVVPKGLTAVILAQIPIQYGLKAEGIENISGIVLMVVFFSIVVSAVLVFIAARGWFKGFGSIYSDAYEQAGRNLKKKFKKIRREKKYLEIRQK